MNAILILDQFRIFFCIVENVTDEDTFIFENTSEQIKNIMVALQWNCTLLTFQVTWNNYGNALTSLYMTYLIKKYELSNSLKLFSATFCPFKEYAM